MTKEQIATQELENKRVAQEELRVKVIEEQLMRDPIIQYVKELKEEHEVVEDPLVYKLVEGTN